jgi:hypothetical protein
MFVIVRMRFCGDKNWKSCPENWKIPEKLKALFSMGTTGPILLIFFLMFVSSNKVFRKMEKLEIWNIREKLKVLFYMEFL